MKTQILKIALLFIVVTSITSCSKDDNDGNDINTGNIFLTAKVDGETIEFEKEEISSSTISLVNGIDLTEINGGYMDGSKSIGISLANINGTGTYTVPDQALILNEGQTASYILLYSYFDEQTQTEWSNISLDNNNSATVTITEFNDNFIAGTFSLMVGDFSDETITPIPIITLTEGRFRAKRD